MGLTVAQSTSRVPVVMSWVVSSNSYDILWVTKLTMFFCVFGAGRGGGGILIPCLFVVQEKALM